MAAQLALQRPLISRTGCRIMGSGAHGNTNSRTVGQYLAARLKEVGVGKFFAVPGDFNMGLLVRSRRFRRCLMTYATRRSCPLSG